MKGTYVAHNLLCYSVKLEEFHVWTGSQYYVTNNIDNGYYF